MIGVPMDKLNLKNILTVIKDFVLRHRVAYRDYLGTETVTEDKVLISGNTGENEYTTADDFTGFKIGEIYNVTVGGATEQKQAINLNALFSFMGEK